MNSNGKGFRKAFGKTMGNSIKGTFMAPTSFAETLSKVVLTMEKSIDSFQQVKVIGINTDYSNIQQLKAKAGTGGSLGSNSDMFKFKVADSDQKKVTKTLTSNGFNLDQESSTNKTLMYKKILGTDGSIICYIDNLNNDILKIKFIYDTYYSGVNESSNNNYYNIKSESYYRSPEYLKVIDEFFDITHNETRKILMNVNETDQNQILASLTHKLYDNIVERVDDIDYSTIPNTKGDITKLENYPKLVQCIETITQLLQAYKQDTSKNIDIVSQALTNIVDRKKLFERAFAYKVELPMIMYSTISLAIVSSVSFIITSSIEFIKSPNQDTFDIELDKVALIKTKENLLFTNLQKFNESCRKGQFDSGMEFVIKNNIKNLTGAEVGLVVGGLALVGILLNILPIMRELIFFFYYSRVRVSDYFDIQADLLQMNAHSLEYNTEKDPDEKKRIIAKQMKIVEMFRKIANKLSINNKQSEVNTTKEIVNNTKKYRSDEILDSVPDSATSALF